MKITILAVMLNIPCNISKAADQPPHSYKPASGYVSDEKTATTIAVAVWTSIYGKEKIENEKPYTATLKKGIWHISGSLPNGKGGVAKAQISKDDGRILLISHGK